MELNGVSPTVDDVKALALTNYGHFTSMLVEDRRVRGLTHHLSRLSRDSRQLFGVDLDIEQVRQYVRDALAGQSTPVVVRVTVYDPNLGLGNIGSEADPQVLVTTRPASLKDAPPMTLGTVSYKREDPSVKHVGLYGAMKNRRFVQREGFDDALFLNPDGTISEIATSNIGFIRGDQIVWPRSEILLGVTMRLLDQGLEDSSTTETLTLADLSEMDAAFATNAATGIRPVAGIDNGEWPTDFPLLHELREMYAEIPGEVV
ncbi:aminotransferase class IV family protein [Actinopolyspora mortivallis]|uniref:Aminotransferase n=1 Tax=Actinopolyspora mortivallis TaxID=33906 RepID=A0A2T0GSQ2_ACTMO|nr:aminotransferase class IV family protein [Actinopolyspora mortivallis]PRW62121.1 aminotransferase [Actinopolyspora mortivallis]